MKIVALGASRRLGATLVRGYRGKFDVTGFNYVQLDLSNLDLCAPETGGDEFRCAR
jgi:hypothetical protein